MSRSAFASDYVERGIGRFGPMVVGLGLVSCLTFLLLPFAGLLGSTLGSALLLGSILVWVVTSSVFRVPPLVMLTKYAPRPTTGWLTALSLFGLGLGGAVSPYLGTLLEAIDPRVPFVVSSLTLAATTLGLVAIERLTRADPAPPEPEASTPEQIGGAVALVLGALGLALAFQLHFFLVSAPRYRELAEPGYLPLLMPVFWIGFNFALFPGAALLMWVRSSVVLAVVASVGMLPLLVCSLAPNLTVYVVGQLFAGLTWGTVFHSGIGAALATGARGREGLVLGAWFSALSGAALLRVGVSIAGLVGAAPWGLMAVALWTLAAFPLVVFAVLQRDPAQAGAQRES